MLDETIFAACKSGEEELTQWVAQPNKLKAVEEGWVLDEIVDSKSTLLDFLEVL